MQLSRKICGKPNFLGQAVVVLAMMIFAPVVFADGTGNGGGASGEVDPLDLAQKRSRVSGVFLEGTIGGGHSTETGFIGKTKLGLETRNGYYGPGTVTKSEISVGRSQKNGNLGGILLDLHHHSDDSIGGGAEIQIANLGDGTDLDRALTITGGPTFELQRLNATGRHTTLVLHGALGMVRRPSDPDSLSSRNGNFSMMVGGRVGVEKETEDFLRMSLMIDGNLITGVPIQNGGDGSQVGAGTYLKSTAGVKVPLSDSLHLDLSAAYVSQRYKVRKLIPVNDDVINAEVYGTQTKDRIGVETFVGLGGRL